MVKYIFSDHDNAFLYNVDFHVQYILSAMSISTRNIYSLILFTGTCTAALFLLSHVTKLRSDGRRPSEPPRAVATAHQSFEEEATTKERSSASNGERRDCRRR